jgi:hypothetical protein
VPPFFWVGRNACGRGRPGAPGTAADEAGAGFRENEAQGARLRRPRTSLRRQHLVQQEADFVGRLVDGDRLRRLSG